MAAVSTSRLERQKSEQLPDLMGPVPMGEGPANGMQASPEGRTPQIMAGRERVRGQTPTLPDLVLHQKSETGAQAMPWRGQPPECRAGGWGRGTRTGGVGRN